ncbi:MAG TPA: S46 family peptidase [Bacteroidales bacterium]|nr:S46 family peptidase [Bacteroidales bacterium]HRX95924.1 S46 family peptidase [Bacteroidales bacterium]
MKSRILFLMIVLLGIQPLARADEGMWLPIFIERLNYTDMEKMGLQLTPEEIYSVNNSSLKDAVAIFGRGCTSEVISDQGLLLTNHHCGYGQIQEHSSVEHNYLKDGFWAMSFEEELPNPGLTASFLIRIEDVTDKVLETLNNDMTEEERTEAVRKVSGELSKAAEEGTHYNASVRSFFEGNEYYLFVYEVFRDVRLVGAPPSSIGKFGADTDNWMWPRHTGDFSIFRVYTDKDGNPADYAEDNVPMKPKHHLPVSIAGVKEGDFSMIMGYPGSTERYMTSYGVKMALDISNQTIVDVRDVKLKIMMEDMEADEAIRIKYASKYARIANYWKYYIGQTKGLKRLKVYDKKVALENQFTEWMDGNQQNKDKYADALPLIKDAYEGISKYELARIYQSEAIMRGSEIIGLASRFSNLKKELEADEVNQENVDKQVQRMKDMLPDYFKDYNLPTDKKLLAAMMKMYYENVPADQQPAYIKEIHKKFKGNFDAYADMVFEKSVFTTSDKVMAFLDDPSAKKLDKDPAYMAAKEFNNFYFENIRPETMDYYDKLDKGNRLFIAGLREMQPNKKFYPDANFTMRLTYGQVLDYYPADAVHYNYFTTMKGIMEKEDPNNWEFVVPEKLKQLYKAKDFGRYGEGEVMKVCFLTNHDITGGNSGSPVMNANGELIGLAFDGNWEAMSGDIVFEPEIQRTINVDIRYVLFIIDKYAGCTRLINEMDIVSKRMKPAKELIEQTEEEPVEAER